MYTLSQEQRLVLMGSIEINKEQEEEFKNILTASIDWKEVLYQLTTHRTANIFYYNLMKYGLANVPDKEIKRIFRSLWLYNKQRISSYDMELKKILDSFNQAGLVVPVLKGNLLISHVYPDPASRVFNDIDFFIKFSDVQKITDVLLNIGYVQGEYDEVKKQIIKAVRKDILFHQISTHELHEFLKIVDNEFAEVICVDVNHNILWQGASCPYKIPGEDLVSRAIPVKLAGTDGWMLDYIDNIIQLSCHLYKEAALMVWISDLRDLKIYKFADLYMYIKKMMMKIDWDELIKRVVHYKIEKIIYFNFHYIELMFGTIVPRNIMDAIKPSNLDFLDEYGVENEKPARWDIPFFERLFDTDRLLKIDEAQKGKMKNFMTQRFEDKEKK